MDDDRVVVDHDDSRRPGPPVRPAWWIIVVGLAAVAGVVLFGGAEETGPTTTTVSVPTVEVPPTLPEGEVVEETIRWEDTAGLEDATHLGGLTAFGDAYWLVGRTESDLVAWRSEEPSAGWTQAAVIDANVPGWLVEDIEVVDQSLVVAASNTRWSGGDGAIYESANGREWVRHVLDTGRPELPVAVPEELVTVDDGMVVIGHGHSRRPARADLDLLPPEVGELVLEGRAYLAEVDGRTRVLLPPGISVAELPVETPDGTSPATPDIREPFLWWGDAPGDLNAESRTNQPAPPSIARLPGGDLVAQTQDGLAMSDDGRSWVQAGPSDGADAGLVPWRNGVVLAAGGEGPAYWERGLSESVPVLPGDLVDEPLPLSTSVAAGDWGLALARQPRRFFNGPGPLPVAETEDGELYLANPLTVELRRDGETVWSQGMGQGQVEVAPDGRLRFGAGEDSIAVQVDDWMEAQYVMSGSGRPSDTAEVIHTVQGEEWSSSSWESISGASSFAELALYGTGEFLLVADQVTFPEPRLNDVALGLPID